MFKKLYDRLEKIFHGCEQNARAVSLTLSSFELLADPLCKLLESYEKQPTRKKQQDLKKVVPQFRKLIQEGLPRAHKAQADLDQLQASARDLCDWLGEKFGTPTNSGGGN